jgi:hypothetical protein
MLKIKDNVDLKELEKYGFKRMKNHFYKCKRNSYLKNLPNGCIEIDSATSLISQDGTGFFRKDEIIYQDTLYDLIKADLVEKIDD